METQMIAFGIIALAILVLVVINRKRKFNELTQEDKDTYKNAKVKIKNISKKKKILYIVAIITIIVLTTTFAIVIEKIEEAQSKTIFTTTIDMYVSPQEKLYSDIFAILRACVLPVFIACAIIEYVFVKKKIKKSEELSEKEKELLNEYYITPILMYVSLCVISFLITYWLLLLPGSFKEL